MIKSGLKKIIGYLYSALPFDNILFSGKIIILLYHRVLPETHPHTSFLQPGMFVSSSTFETNIKQLIKKYRFTTIENLLLNQIENTKKRYCILTFDDGWLDNYLYAFPILKKYNIPATIFLTVDYIGSKKWLWTDIIAWFVTNKSDILKKINGLNDFKAILQLINSTVITRHKFINKIDFLVEKLKLFPENEIYEFIEYLKHRTGLSHPEERIFLNWDEVIEMSQAGISFGSHTRGHRILTRLKEEEIVYELSTSLEIIKQKNINFVPVLSYPNGDKNKKIEKIAQACGYIGAVTTRYGFESTKPADPFSLRRIGVHQDIASSDALFAFHLSGLKNLI